MLHYACQHGRMDIVEKVLAACSLESLRETLSHHPTPCNVAEENGHDEIKQRLSAMLVLDNISSPVTSHLEPSNVNEFESDVPPSITLDIPGTCGLESCSVGHCPGLSVIE